MRKIIKILIFWIAFLSIAGCESLVYAESIDVTLTYKIDDPKVEDGDIVFNDNRGINRANAPYSNKIFGVIQDKPIVVLRTQEANSKPVARIGQADVVVTNLNGSIKKGDYITSSEIAGKGMRATLSGYVIGMALSDLDEARAQKFNYKSGTTGNTDKSLAIAKIPVALRIEFAELSSARSTNRLIEYFNTALFSSAKDPEKFVQIFRYVAAAVVAILSFIIGFVVFARSTSKGVEAIGRNPLARNAIQFTVILNIALTAGTIILGIVAAFVILKI